MLGQWLDPIGRGSSHSDLDLFETGSASSTVVVAGRSQKGGHLVSFPRTRFATRVPGFFITRVPGILASYIKNVTNDVVGAEIKVNYSKT